MNATAAPLIGIGEVRHRRSRPRPNAFTYPSCFLLLPMRTLRRDPQAAGALAFNRRGILSFHESDHGDGRLPNAGGALAWLDALLAAHGIHDATGEAWLQAFPRLWGYSFKPVSFWFCHREDGSLRAVVAEVHNTFGERHNYLLDAPAWGAEVQADKVFHVSPFCEVQGRYRFRFMRTEGADARTLVRIDYDDATGPLLETSIAGRLSPLTAAAIRRAVLAFPLLTFGIVWRIHWQALRLAIKRTPFFGKPAPPAVSTSLARAAETNESAATYRSS
ncbi:DUF1365 family protein [Xylophilus rhododendri]|uniref:DUF1365 family protein n=1 Tax=Xylophilus rhododendri TaxID=2697032 RepID=A0A857J4V8_9BURK|nr:DUF1365 domain-containing protein [Xylophilus rhododendri]QHI99004.1 DUF1365 family protein [Xylophilus rhododendri]